MVELLHRVAKGDVIEGEAHVGGNRKADKRNPGVSRSTGGRNVQTIVQLYERCSGSKSIREECKLQDIESVMRRSPHLTAFQQPVETSKCGVRVVELPVESRVESPKMQGVLVVAKSAATTLEGASLDSKSTEGFRQGNKAVKRKASCFHKEIVHTVDSVSQKIADSIDRIHTAKLQCAEDKVKVQESLFYTEFNYLKKRDRRLYRNQQNLISAIKGLTEVITTRLKDTGCAGDARKKIVDVEAEY